MTRWLLILALLLAQGCASFRDDSDEYITTPPRIPGRYTTTPKGTRVYTPLWLADSAQMSNIDPTKTQLQQAHHEIDNTPPEVDARLPALPTGLVGAPPGFTIWIQDPGRFSTRSTASSTGLAAGQTDMHTNVWVRWRVMPYEKNIGRLMPALGHEYGHAYYNIHVNREAGVCAGHPDDTTCATEHDHSEGE